MWDLLVDALSWAAILAGGFFLIVGAIGLNRMPDLYCRLHATGISDTAGAGLLLLGMMFQAGLTLVSVKLAFIALIFFFTSPVATHAVTRAALSVGVEPKLFDAAGHARKAVLQEVRKDRTAPTAAARGRASGNTKAGASGRSAPGKNAPGKGGRRPSKR